MPKRKTNLINSFLIAWLLIIAPHAQAVDITLPSQKGSALTIAEGEANHKRQVTEKTAAYTTLVTDNRDIIEANTTSNITLGDASNMIAAADTGDYQVGVACVHASGCTVVRTSTDTIDGQTSLSLAQYEAMIFKANSAGNGYSIIARGGYSQASVDINGGTIDGVTIGGSSAGAGTFTTLNATGGGALTGTWTDLGSVTTVDINGGTVDATDITVGAGKTLDVSAGTLTLANDQISGDKLNGGTYSAFTSTGIDDNSTINTLLLTDSLTTFKSSGDGILEIVGAGSGNRNAYIDFVGDDTYTDFGLRIIRNSGVNANSIITNRGTGGLYLQAVDAGSVVLNTSATDSLTVDASGNVSVDRGHLILQNAKTLISKDSGGSQRSMLYMYSDDNVYLDNSAAGNITFRTGSTPGSPSTQMALDVDGYLSHDLKRVLAISTAGTSIASGGAYTAIAFNGETYDTSTMHDNVTNNTRLTTPSGATLVRLSGCYRWNGSFTAISKIAIGKNGTYGTIPGLPEIRDDLTAGASAYSLCTSSAAVTVTGGTDYFELFSGQDSGGAQTISTTSGPTWFAMEVIK